MRVVNVIPAREVVRRRSGSFLSGESLFRRAILSRSASLPLRGFELRGDGGRHRMRVDQVVGPIGVRQKPIRRRRRSGGGDGGVTLLLMLLLLMEVGAESVFIAFHFEEREKARMGRT